MYGGMQRAKDGGRPVPSSVEISRILKLRAIAGMDLPPVAVFGLSGCLVSHKEAEDSPVLRCQVRRPPA